MPANEAERFARFQITGGLCMLSYELAQLVREAARGCCGKRRAPIDIDKDVTAPQPRIARN
jgi:hypothetical protein